MPSLFDPLTIGAVELRNRIMFAPMATGYEEKNLVGPRSLAFYRRLARGGAGLIVLGGCAVQPPTAPVPGIFDDRFIPGLRELVEAVHVEGAKIAAQLVHAEVEMAGVAEAFKSGGRDAAVKRMAEDAAGLANRLTLEQIRALQDRYVSAARRAAQAGFDLVQVHGGYLPGMFFSPVQNHRQDGYGGSLENRARFALEVVLRIRQAAPGAAVCFLLPVHLGAPGKFGLVLEEARRLVPWLQKAGAACVHIAPADHTDLPGMIPPAGAQEYGWMVAAAAAVKETSGIPVAVGGRIIRPEFAAAVIEQGRADLVALGRGLLADPEWPLKVLEGRETEIRECIMCNRCADSLLGQQPVECTVNAQTGSRVEAEITPAEQPLRVLVAGGGPAGMEAARVAALRGHSVTLVEQARALGGQLRRATSAPGREETRRISVFLAREMARLGIDVRFGAPVDVEMVRALAPDRVVVATGVDAHAQSPLDEAVHQEVLPGAYSAHVVDAREALGGQPVTGQTVVVVGGGLLGVNAAILLASQGKQVTVIEKSSRVGRGDALVMLPVLEERLRVAGVHLLTGFEAVEILPEGVRARGADQKIHTIRAQSVILAVGIRRPNHTLSKALKRASIAFIEAGDCRGDEASWLNDAIHSGFEAGLKL